MQYRQGKSMVNAMLAMNAREQKRLMAEVIIAWDKRVEDLTTDDVLNLEAMVELDTIETVEESITSYSPPSLNTRNEAYKMNLKDIMIDIETMGTGPTSAMVQIGAVRFCLETGEVDSPKKRPTYRRRPPRLSKLWGYHNNRHYKLVVSSRRV